MNSRSVSTARGAEVRVFEYGSSNGTPAVFMHGLSGLLDDWRFLELLAREHRVIAPELPGYGESTGEELLEDMLDFALHGWDILRALDVNDAHPMLIGHSLGGMIAAEMACLAPELIDKLVLIDPLGLWLDAYPIVDAFSLLPYEFAEYLFHDAARAQALLPGTSDLANEDELRDFFAGNSRRLGTAGKMLFPIPNRRVSKRLYRLRAPTLVVWGEQDRYVPPAYAEHWAALLPSADVVRIAEAGHMLPYEQPEALAQAVAAFAG
ncbi:MAG: alpha/beta fold hydrolase [Chloroflexi bacterium]|nr:alpha/beta fold hydrolase [Chloroflexota bacterium]